MRTLTLLLCLALMPMLALGAPEPKAADASKQAPWSVRIELLIVDLPQEMALTLLPDLRDDAKIDGAFQRIMEAIQRKEATLVGYPIIQMLSGQKATSETIDEFIYPTQFQPPTGETRGVDPAVKWTTVNNLVACPTNFEKRNLGVTLEIEPVVEPGGKWLQLNLQPQHVVFQGFEWYECGKNEKATASLPQPRFFTTKVSTSMRVRNGQRVLCQMHKLKQPEGQMELFIVQAVATRADD